MRRRIMSSEMLTVNDVAERFSVQPATVRGWIKARALATVKLGPRGTRVSEEALRAFVSMRTMRAVSPGKR